MSPAREKLAFAADVPLDAGVAMYRAISPSFGVAKVGLSLFVEHGPRAVEAFQAVGAKVFLDLKLHDIPNTVELAAARAGALGVGYLTVHATGGEAMVRAAVAGAAEGATKAGHGPPVILAVTVLTSMDAAALASTGVSGSALEQVQRLAALSQRAGATGLVCSAHEAAALRKALGPKVVLCTPGIRPAGAAVNDQARVETPASAIRAGASLLVVGRPISTAADHAAAAAAIAADVTAAVST